MLGNFCTSWAPLQKFPNVEKDFKGAIDGTHIAAILPPNEQISYIGRKGLTTQNVMT
ncbi:hypothetical protein Gotri_022848, partial [Gossypium trilobum]|nr:hypothetical protein [Gossypium trilobum]